MAEKALVERLKGLTADQLKAGLASRVLQVSSQNYAYLKFDGRSGVMNVNDGDKEARFDDKTELAFNLLGSTQGYICWKNGEAIGDFARSFFDSLPPIETMEDNGPYEDPEKDGWQTQYQLFFKDLKTNTQYILRLVSKSGRRQVDNFIKNIHENVAVHDFTKQTPVVTIQPAMFVAKGNKNYKPVFSIVKWVNNPDEVAAPVAAGAITHSKKEAAPAHGVKLAAKDIEDSRD